MRKYPKFALIPLLLLLLSLPILDASGQCAAPPESFLIDGPGIERIHSVKSVPVNCSFVMTGSVDDAAQRSLLVLYVTNNTINWQRTYSIPGVSFAEGRNVIVASNGDIIVAGNICNEYLPSDSIYPNASNNNDIFIARLSSTNGAVLWLRTFARTSPLQENLNDFITPNSQSHIIESVSNPNTFYLVGNSNFYPGNGMYNDPEGIVLHFGGDGSTIWVEEIDYSNDDYADFFHGIAVDADPVGFQERIILVGESHREVGFTDIRGVITRLWGADGSSIDHNAISPLTGGVNSANSITFRDIALSENGSYAVVGGVGNFGQRDNIYFSRFSNVGLTAVTQKMYGFANSWERAGMINLTSVPAPMFFGHSICASTTMLEADPNSNSNYDMIAFSTDFNGNLLSPPIVLGMPNNNEEGYAMDNITGIAMAVGNVQTFGSTFDAVYVNQGTTTIPQNCYQKNMIMPPTELSFTGGQLVQFIDDEVPVSNTPRLAFAIQPGIQSLPVCCTAFSAGIMQLPSCPGDNDGSVSISITDGAGPYSLSYVVDGFTASLPFSLEPGEASYTFTNLVAGNYVFTVTDANGCSATRNALLVPINNNCCPYQVGNVEVPCTASTIQIPIVAPQPVSPGIIGFDFTLQYDPAVMTPQSTATPGPVVLNGNPTNYATVTLNTATPGVINGTIYFNPIAGQGAEFGGAGTVVTLNFTPVALGGAYSLPVTASFVRESYLTSHADVCADAGTVSIVPDNQLNTTLRFWNLISTNRVLGYDGTNLPTYVELVDGSCSLANISSATLPNASGQVSLNTSGATHLRITRDIPAAAPCQVISNLNASDLQFITRIINQTNFSAAYPVFAFIAADVNMDGVVSGGDATLLQQRAAGLICDFPQPNFGALDWRFVNSGAVTTAEYQRSLTFPGDDGAGFSRDRIPQPPACLPLTYTTSGAGCISLQDEQYYSILLGDVNSSWTLSANGATQKSTAEAVVIDLKSALNLGGNLFEVPVYVESNDAFYGLDFHLRTNNSALRFHDIRLSDAAEAQQVRQMFNNSTEGNLVVVGYTMGELQPGQNVYYLQVEAPDGHIEAVSLEMVEAYIDGEPVTTKVTAYASSEGVTQDQAITGGFDFRIFPNPAQGTTSVAYNLGDRDPSAAFVRVTDMNGRLIREIRLENASGSLSLDAGLLGSGIYAVELWAGSEVKLGTRKLVVQ